MINIWVGTRAETIFCLLFGFSWYASIFTTRAWPWVYQWNVRAPAPQRPYLAHVFHASCDHNAGVSHPYWLGCQAHGFQAWPTDHLAAPCWNRVGDSCTHTGSSNRILPATWKKEHRGLSALKEKNQMFGAKYMQNQVTANWVSCYFPDKPSSHQRQKDLCTLYTCQSSPGICIIWYILQIFHGYKLSSPQRRNCLVELPIGLEWAHAALQM